MKKNPLTATNMARRQAAASPYGNRVAFARAGADAVYPLVPSWWPNRLVRRAVKQGREFRLSAPWKGFLSVNPKLRAQIVSL